MNALVNQSSKSIVMVRPHLFRPNPQTASDNPFQKDVTADLVQLASDAKAEFDSAVGILADAGIDIRVFEDTPEPTTPDAVFPNNWFSTHPDGSIVLYPMRAPARRNERRADILDWLIRDYGVADIVDISAHEEQERFLEGTGSLVFDYVRGYAYMAVSGRSDRQLAEELCSRLGMIPIIFRAADPFGSPVYHTNVLMCIGTDIALVGLELIDRADRERVRSLLIGTGRAVIELDASQVADFAGNAIELANHEERLLVMSDRAARCLRSGQRALIESHARIVSFSIPTIELSGGSARCMIASIHLPPRTADKA